MSGQIYSHDKRLHGHMFDVVDAAFSYWRALIVCYFLLESSKVKESSLYVMWNVHTAFLLCVGASMLYDIDELG